MFYWLAIAFLNLYRKVLFRVEYKGLENIPKKGPVVLCANHQSNYDPIVITVKVKRPVHYVAKKSLFGTWYLKLLFKGLNCIPVDRDNASMETYKASLAILEKGGILGVFAQGHRIKSEEAQENKDPAKGGAVLFALKGNATLIPVNVTSTYERRAKVYVTFGKPYNLDEYRGKRVRTPELNKITEGVMDAIWDLAPKES